MWDRQNAEKTVIEDARNPSSTLCNRMFRELRFEKDVKCLVAFEIV